MERELLKYILPEGILEHFEIVQVSEFLDNKTQTKVLRVELDEKNILPENYKAEDYESKGFYRAVHIKDFPVRDKALLLVISRRRWRHKVNKSEEIRNTYSFIAEGSRITQELSDFLKDTD